GRGACVFIGASLCGRVGGCVTGGRLVAGAVGAAGLASGCGHGRGLVGEIYSREAVLPRCQPARARLVGMGPATSVGWAALLRTIPRAAQRAKRNGVRSVAAHPAKEARQSRPRADSSALRTVGNWATSLWPAPVTRSSSALHLPLPIAVHRSSLWRIGIS